MANRRQQTIRWICGGLVWAVSLLVHAAEAEPLNTIIIYPWQSAPAFALSRNETTLSARIAAQVDAIPVQVSQQVKQGELLLELDCADYRLELASARAQRKAAEARLTLAQNQLQRTLQLRRRELVSQEQEDSGRADVQVARAILEQARVSIEQAELQVGRCRIEAPFDGQVTQRLAAEGEWAVVGTPLLTVVETGTIDLSARVAADAVALLQQSNTVQFDFGKQVPAALVRVGTVVDSQTRNVEVRLAFTEEIPRPGTAGKLVWRDPRPFIPSRYIVNRDGQLGIFLVQADKAVFHVLKGALPGRDFPTDLGLDTQVITQGLGTVQAGDPFTRN